MMSNRLVQFSCFLLLLSTVACSTAKKGSVSGDMMSSGKSLQTRKKITEYAKKYVGTAYKYAGTNPKTGFDCSGFTSYVLKSFQVEISPASAEQAKEGKKIPLDKVLPGDLIFFGDSAHIQHVALVVERTQDGIICVHSTNSHGVMVENVSTSEYWKPRILFARDVLSR
jgi:cell wall-associated NlpC family hydrolase